MQTVFLGRAHSKQSVKALFQTVTRLRDRTCQAGWTYSKESLKEYGGNVKGRKPQLRPKKWACPERAAWRQNRHGSGERKSRATVECARDWATSAQIRRGDILRRDKRFPDRYTRKCRDAPAARAKELRRRSRAAQEEARKAASLLRLRASPIRARR